MKKILVIDDDKDLSALMKPIFEKAGYAVVFSNNPSDGIDAAKAEKPDLILMDVMLPGINGAEAVKILSSERIIRDIPVIFLTALLSDSEKYEAQAGIKVGTKHYEAIAKPFEIKDLLAKVKAAIG